MHYPDDPLFSGIQLSIVAQPGSGERKEGFGFLLKNEGSESDVFVRIVEAWSLEDGDAFAAGKQVFLFKRS